MDCDCIRAYARREAGLVVEGRAAMTLSSFIHWLADGVMSASRSQASNTFFADLEKQITPVLYSR